MKAGTAQNAPGVKETLMRRYILPEAPMPDPDAPTPPGDPNAPPIGEPEPIIDPVPPGGPG